MSSASSDPINNFESNAGSFRSGTPSASRARRTGDAPRPEMKRRVMDVEDVLSWAYRDELPKSDGLHGGRHGPPAYVSPLARMVAVGVNVDNWSREPGFPSAMGPPHADALKVQAALRDIVEAGRAIRCLDSELRLMPDLPALGVDEVEATRVALRSVEAIVERCAKLRERPYWTRETVPRPMRHPNGPVQVVRWEPMFTKDLNGEEVEHQALVHLGPVRRGDYPFGSYCPVCYEPDPKTIAAERAEYLVWWGAMNAIAEALEGKLDSIAILPPGAAQRPWLGDEDLGKPPRVFEDLTGRVYQREQREIAAAHRMLGLRGSVGARGAARTRGAPTRVVRTASRRAAAPSTAACAAR